MPEERRKAIGARTIVNGRRLRPQHRGHRWYQPDLNIERDRAYLIGRDSPLRSSPWAIGEGKSSRRTAPGRWPNGREGIRGEKSPRNRRNRDLRLSCAQRLWQSI